MLRTALYIILVKDSPSALTTTGVLFYNAALSLPLLVLATVLCDLRTVLRAALYLILVKDSPSALSTTGVLFYNAALSLPLLVVATSLSGEPALIREYPLKGDPGFRVRHSMTSFQRM